MSTQHINVHELVLDGSTSWPDEDLIRQRFHCSACNLIGILHVRPAEQLNELMSALRQHHRTAALIREIHGVIG